MYNGLEATIWRHAAWNGGYFGVIFGVKEWLPKAKVCVINHRCDKISSQSRSFQNKNEQLVNNFIAGTIGGTFGTMLNTPMDVVKTRIQGYTGQGPKKYNWTLPSIALVAKEEGYVGFVIKKKEKGIKPNYRVAALYRGFTAKVLRLGPG